MIELSRRSAFVALFAYVCSMLLVVCLTYTPSPSPLRTASDGALTTTTTTTTMRTMATTATNAAAAMLVVASGVTPAPAAAACASCNGTAQAGAVLRLLARLVTVDAVDARLENDVLGTLRKHKLLPTTASAKLFRRLNGTASNAADRECDMRTAVLSRAVADKEQRVTDLSKQLSAASAKLQAVVVQENVKCSDKQKQLREQLELRDEQLADAERKLRALQAKVAELAKQTSAADERIEQLQDSLARSQDSLVSCRTSLSDVTKRKEEYKALLEAHETAAGGKAGRATATLRAATAEWHRTVAVLPDSLEMQFQKQVFESQHPLLCDDDHERFVLVRVAGLMGAEGILEHLSLALTYAITSRRVMVVASGADTPLWAARDGCADASPLCFLEAPSSCRERDISQAVHNKKKPLLRSTETGALSARVVLFDGGCQTEQQDACLTNNPYFRQGACLTCAGGRLWLEGQLMRYLFQPREAILNRIKEARSALVRDWPVGAPIVGVDVARSFECFTAAGQRGMSCPEAPTIAKALHMLAERVPLAGALIVSESQFAVDSVREFEQSVRGLHVFAAPNVTRLCERPKAPVREQPDFPLRSGCAARFYFGAGGHGKPAQRQQFVDAPAFNATQEVVDRFVELGLVLQAEHFVGVSTSPFSRAAIRLMYAFDQLHGDFGSQDWLLVDDAGSNWPFGNAALYLQSLTNSGVASNRILQHVVKSQLDAPLFAGSLRVAQAEAETSTSETPSTTADDGDAATEARDGVDLFVQRQQQRAKSLQMQHRRIPSLAAKVAVATAAAASKD
jgi:hypothetical protein